MVDLMLGAVVVNVNDAPSKEVLYVRIHVEIMDKAYDARLIIVRSRQKLSRPTKATSGFTGFSIILVT